MNVKFLVGTGIVLALLVGGIVFLGPELIDRVSPPVRVPPPVPIQPTGPVAPPPDEVVSAPGDAGAADGIEVVPTPAEPEAPGGTLSLVTRPAGLKVLQGEAELGETPLDQVKVPVGRLDLTLVDAKGRKKTLKVLVREGQTTTVTTSWAKLKP